MAISTTALLTAEHADSEGLATHLLLRTFGGGLPKGQVPPTGLTKAWGRTLEGQPLGQHASFPTGLGGASLVPRTLSQIWEPGHWALPLSLLKPAVRQRP